MGEYQLGADDTGVMHIASGPNQENEWVPADPGNKDWQEYQQWLADGGVPDPYVPPDSVLFDPVFDKGNSMYEILTG